MNYSGSEKETRNNVSNNEIEFAGNFVNAAREMHLSENPNAARVGCFTDEQIRKITNSVKLPDDSVMNHLFSCSECFGNYRQALILTKKAVEKESRLGWLNISGWSATRISLVGASFALLAGLSFSLVWFFQMKPPVELAKSIEVSKESPDFGNGIVSSDNNQPISNQELNKHTTTTEKQSDETQSNKTTINRKRNLNLLTEKRPQEFEQSKNDSLNLILSESNILRNTNNFTQEITENKELVLPAEKINLNIKLPKGFSGGRYKISIVDAFGNSLFERKTSLKNRKLLMKNLNLQTLENRANKLCLQKSGEIPDCFDIKITK